MVNHFCVGYGACVDTSHNIRGVILALCGGIGWGFSGACAQYMFSRYGIDPIWVSSLRMLCSGLLLCAFALVAFRGAFLALWKRPQTIVHLLVFSLAGLAFCQITYLITIDYSNAGTATVIQYICPVLIVAYICLRGHRAPTLREVMAIILVILGTYLLATHGDPSSMVLSPQALFWGLTSAFAYALYSLLPGKLMLQYGSIPVVSAALLLGGIVVACFVQPWNTIPAFDAFGWVVLLGGMVLCGTTISFTCFFQAVKDIGAAKTSLIASVETVSATLFAVLWLGTSFALIDFVGFIFIVATVFILASQKDAPQKEGSKTKQHKKVSTSHR